MINKFEPITFNINSPSEDITEGFGFFDGEFVRCLTMGIYDTEEEARDQMDAWKGSHCKLIEVNYEGLTNKYAFVGSPENYFIKPECISEIKYLNDSENSDDDILYFIIFKYIVALR